MKEITKRLISNKTSQDRSIRLKYAATRYVAKISNESLQERSLRLKLQLNITLHNATKKSIETSPE
jgi:hypothetical protein